MPDCLQETKYHRETQGKSAWQKSMKTDLNFFGWMKQNPEGHKWFQQLIGVPRESEWFHAIPFAEEIRSARLDRIFFVDVGGSVGHQSAQLKDMYTSLQGRIIVQDLEEIIKAAPPIEGIEFMTHDFFNPQPIKGMFTYQTI
jgi:hypothetical protein